MSQHKQQLDNAIQRRTQQGDLGNVMYDGQQSDGQTDAMFAKLAAIKRGDVITPAPEPQTVYIEVVPEGAIVPAENGALQFGNFTLDPNGLIWGEGTTYEEWDALGERIFKIGKASQWWIGDYANVVSETWGDKIEDIADRHEIDPETLTDWQNVSKNVPLPLRNGGLSFSHHRAVAFLKKDKQPDHEAMREWLEKAAVKNWSVKELRTEIVRSKSRGGRPTPTKLASRNNQDLIARVWKAVKANKPIDRKDIQELRKWLLDVERRLASTSTEPEYSNDLD